MTGRPTPHALAGVPEVAKRPSREQVRQRLLTAALDVFLEVGYGDARLDDIARLAGFTTGAIYSNFGSKQDLFAALLTTHSIDLGAVTLQRLDAVGDDGPPDPRAALVERVVDDPRWNQLITEFALLAARNDDVRVAFVKARKAQRAALAASLRDRAPQLGLAGDVDFDLAALTLFVLIDGLALEHSADPATITADVIRAVLDALTPTWGPTPATPEP